MYPESNFFLEIELKEESKIPFGEPIALMSMSVATYTVVQSKLTELVAKLPKDSESRPGAQQMAKQLASDVLALINEMARVESFASLNMTVEGEAFIGQTAPITPGVYSLFPLERAASSSAIH